MTVRRPKSVRLTYRATIAYDGRGFAGYARQPGADTVEGALLEALVGLFEGPPALIVAGRTDRGVSATGQVVSFKASSALDPGALVAAIDLVRPGRLACLEARPEHRRFHAQFSARARRYAYRLPAPPDLDLARLDRLLLGLQGRRCFSAFARDTPPGQSTVRTLHEARARLEPDPEGVLLRIDLMADAFLRRMVRVLVATAIRECQAGAPDDALARIALTGDRQLTAHAAPPEGLTLVKVIY